jgi:hypothetical protein
VFNIVESVIQRSSMLVCLSEINLERDRGGGLYIRRHHVNRRSDWIARWVAMAELRGCLSNGLDDTWSLRPGY